MYRQYRIRLLGTRYDINLIISTDIKAEIVKMVILPIYMPSVGDIDTKTTSRYHYQGFRP